MSGSGLFVPSSTKLDLAVDEAKARAESAKLKAKAVQLEKDVHFLADELKRLTTEHPTGNFKPTELATYYGATYWGLKMFRDIAKDDHVKAVWKLYVPWRNLSEACLTYQQKLDNHLHVALFEDWNRENHPPYTTAFFILSTSSNK